MSDPFVGEIRLFAGNFAPRDWALCNGSLLPISQNTALFSLLGTFYGGDGRTTFALPDLRGRAPLHQGQGPGLTPRTLGEAGGAPVVTLTTGEMPSHAHTLGASGNDANTATAAGGVAGLASSNLYRSDGNTTMAPNALAATGSGQPHNNSQPYLIVTFIIALSGIYPPRS